MKLKQSVRSVLLFDGESSTYNYIGEAPIGSSAASPVWRIFRLEYTGTNSLAKKWADNSDSFNKVWNDRASYSYI